MSHRFRQGEHLRLQHAPTPHSEGSKPCPGDNGHCGKLISANKLMCFPCWAIAVRLAEDAQAQAAA